MPIEFNNHTTSTPEATFVSRSLREMSQGISEDEIPMAQEATFDLQRRIIADVLGTHPDVDEFLQRPFSHVDGETVTRETLLIEYTTAQLAREFAELEQVIYKNAESGLQFYVHDAGQELATLAVARLLTNQDGWFPYYRAQTIALYRRPDLRSLFAQDLHRTGDSHSLSRQLGGHISIPEASIATVSSMTAINLLPSVSVAASIKAREKLPPRQYRRFNDPQAIVVATVGEASLDQGEALEAMHQAVLDHAPWLLMVMDNGTGISMGLADTAVGGDPIVMARGLTAHGMKITDVSAASLPDLYREARNSVNHVRNERLPAILHIHKLSKMTSHTSSGQEVGYIPPDLLNARKEKDGLPQFEKFLLDRQVVDERQLEALKARIADEVKSAFHEVVKRPPEDVQLLRTHTYHPDIPFTSVQLTPEVPAVQAIDIVGSTRREREGVIYSDKTVVSDHLLTMRQMLTLSIARAMYRYPDMILFGEDVANLSRDYWPDLHHYFEQMYSLVKPGKYTKEQVELAWQSVDLVSQGLGYTIDPPTFGILADIMQGKGGVFGNTQFLQYLFGIDRVFNSPLSESRIAGRVTGEGMAGRTGIGEIQFGSYASPATMQINDWLSNLRWRSGGGWDAGGIFLVNSMGRVGGNGIDDPGGVGGIGHFDAWISRFRTPGLLNIIPADASEIGPLFAESADIAVQLRQPILFWVPINSLTGMKGFDQGPEARIPLNEAEIRRTGDNLDLHIVAWSNNVRIADHAAQKLHDDHGIEAGIINLRSMTPDWEKVLQELRKSGKVIVFEAGRGYDSAIIEQVVSENLYPDIDGPVISLHGIEIPTPAGKGNEAYAVPQASDLIRTALDLAAY